MQINREPLGSFRFWPKIGGLRAFLSTLLFCFALGFRHQRSPYTFIAIHVYGCLHRALRIKLLWIGMGAPSPATRYGTCAENVCQSIPWRRFRFADAGLIRHARPSPACGKTHNGGDGTLCPPTLEYLVNIESNHK